MRSEDFRAFLPLFAFVLWAIIGIFPGEMYMINVLEEVHSMCSEDSKYIRQSFNSLYHCFLS